MTAKLSGRKVHWLTKGKRRTACGRPAKSTKTDTRDKSKVTCATCRRVLDTWDTEQPAKRKPRKTVLLPVRYGSHIATA